MKKVMLAVNVLICCSWPFMFLHRARSCYHNSRSSMPPSSLSFSRPWLSASLGSSDAAAAAAHVAVVFVAPARARALVRARRFRRRCRRRRRRYGPRCPRHPCRPISSSSSSPSSVWLYLRSELQGKIISLQFLLDKLRP